MNANDIVFESQQKFLNGEINYEEFWIIFEKYRFSLKPPWKTDVWHSNRESKLRDKCSCCGSSEKLIIQHIWHPRGFSQVLKSIEDEKCQELETYMNLFDETVYTDTVENLECCPFCNGKNIRYRKTMGTYRCDTRREKIIQVQDTNEEFKFFRGLSYQERREQKIVFERVNPRKKLYRRVVRCLEVFETPQKKPFITDHREYKIARAKRKYKDDFLQPIALRVWINENRRYVSLQDGDFITACKQCAYEQDVKNGFIKKDRRQFPWSDS